MRDNIKATQLGRELEWVNATAEQTFEQLNLQRHGGKSSFKKADLWYWDSFQILCSTLIVDAMMDLQMYRDDIHSKLGPYAQETAERFNEDLQLLTSKLRTHMEEAKGRVTEYSQELRTMVEQNAEDVKNRVNTYAKKLRKRFNKDIQEINKWVMVSSLITWAFAYLLLHKVHYRWVLFFFRN